MSDAKTVDFYFSCPSRYSYLASTQVAAIEARHGCRFRWLPVRNGAVVEARGPSPFNREVPPSGQYDWPYREYDATCWANYYGVPYVEPVNFRKDPPFIVRSCYAAEAQGQLVPFARRLSQAIFVESRAIDEAVLAELAGELGLDGAAFRAAFDDPAVAAREMAVLEEATRIGVFGVPTFLFEGRLFWGNDRLVLLEHALSGGALPPGLAG